MAIEQVARRRMARARAAADVAERKLVRERGGDIFRLESAQMKALQELLVSWPEDEKWLFIKMYAEEVWVQDNKYLYWPNNARGECRAVRVMRWMIGGVIVLFTLFLLVSRK